VTVAALKKSSKIAGAASVQSEAFSVPIRLTTGRAPAVAAQSKRAESLGTLAFTHQFQACLEAALRSETAEDRLPFSQWHKSAYVVGRLRARVGHKLVAAVLAKTAALERLSNDTDPKLDDWRVYRKVYDDTLKAAISRFGLTHREVAKAERQIMALVRSELMAHQRRRIKAA
jgi:hypothetical protein